MKNKHNQGVFKPILVFLAVLSGSQRFLAGISGS